MNRRYRDAGSALKPKKQNLKWSSPQLFRLLQKTPVFRCYSLLANTEVHTLAQYITWCTPCQYDYGRGCPWLKDLQLLGHRFLCATHDATHVLAGLHSESRGVLSSPVQDNKNGGSSHRHMEPAYEVHPVFVVALWRGRGSAMQDNRVATDGYRSMWPGSKG